MKKVPAKIFKQHMEHYLNQISRYNKPIHIMADNPAEDVIVISKRDYDAMMATLAKYKKIASAKTTQIPWRMAIMTALVITKITRRKLKRKKR